MQHSARVIICEVGMRDGLQIEPVMLSTQKKVELLSGIIASGVTDLEVTSFVSPKAVPQMADAEEVLAEIKRGPHTRLIALVPNLRGADRAARAHLDTGMLMCSASETHSRKNINRSVSEQMASFPDVAACLIEGGKEVMGGVSMAFGCPFEGDVAIDTLRSIVASYSDASAQTVVLCDTTGMATPPIIRSTLRTLKSEFPSVEFGLHLHNTRGIGLVNVMVGLEEGVRRFDASTAGLGGCPFAAGATGNVCTEDLVYLLEQSGWHTGVDLERSIAVAKELEVTLGRNLPGQLMRAGSRLRKHSTDEICSATG